MIASTPRSGLLRLLTLATLLLPLAAPVRAQHEGHHAAQTANDPRVGLKAGWQDAGVAAKNLELVAHVSRPEGFVDPSDPGNFSLMNSDLAFKGDTLFLGNFGGVQVWDISNPEQPTLRLTIRCPGGQGDVSVHGNLLFMSVEETRGRLDCGEGGVPESVSAARFRGVRIFDISDLDNLKQVAAVQTCRGSHTHTLVPDANDPNNVYIYVSGTSQVRSGEELAGCSDAAPDEDPNTAYFRIEVIKVPVHHPEQATVIGTPRFLMGLTAPPAHGETPGDVIARLGLSPVTSDNRAAVQASQAFTAEVEGQTYVMSDAVVKQALAYVMGQQGRAGTPAAQDSTALRQMLPGLIAQMLAERPGSTPGEARPGPTACHDITVFPEVGLAGGACDGYGILLDIRNPADPKRLDAASDANFAYWHSATFSNDGRKVIFTDEWGGGTAPRCRVTDRPEWGADAIFTIEGDSLRFHSYYKLPAPQTAQENCVAHNGSLVPVPGRDIMAQAWYQGGVSLFDFTDPAHPVEIAYFDRGPMNAEHMAMGGYWSVYWHNGYLYGSEIGRGLDVFKLVPSEHLTAAEIAAAESVHREFVNTQHQTRIAWPATFTVARAYVDALAHTSSLPAERTAQLARDLEQAQGLSGQARQTALRRLATSVRALQADDARLAQLADTLEALGSRP